MSPSRHDNLEAALARVFEDQNTRASWFALTGGELLFSAGDEPDSLYLVRSGRLGGRARAYYRPREPASLLSAVIFCRLKAACAGSARGAPR